MATVQDIAKEAASYFTTVTRCKQSEDESRANAGNDADTIWVLKYDRPQWLDDLVYYAHGDMMPDDWRYEVIVHAVDFIEENDNAEDISGEFADSMVDTYNWDRIQWLSSHLSRVSYCDEAIQEYGYASGNEPFSIVDMIGWGQYAEASEIFGSVLRSLEEEAERTCEQCGSLMHDIEADRCKCADEAVEDEAENRCDRCGESTADGEGYAGLCGNCADADEAAEQEPTE